VFNYFSLGRRAYKIAAGMGEPKRMPAILYNGVPGCGKTFEIRAEFTENDVILVTVRTTKDSILAQLLSMPKFKGMHQRLEPRVRTLDSANMHGVPLAHVMYVDEGLMAHSGAITMAVAEAQPAEVRVFGDTEQIGLIDRGSKIGNLHFESLFYWTQIIMRDITARCPADATMLFASLYPEERRGNIRTYNPVLRSITFERVEDVKDPRYVEPEKPYVYYSALRADRGKLVMLPGFCDGKQRFPDCEDPVRPVFSIHEVQGETYPFVTFYRMNVFNSSLFASKPHLVVAFTRHTLRCRYRGPNGPEEDMAARLAVTAMNRTDEELRSVVLPAPDWVIKRMHAEETKFAKYLS